MTKKLLLAGAAAMTLMAAPAFAQTVDAEVDYSNNIETNLENSNTWESDITVEGDVDVRGTIRVDSSASALSDSKQVIEGNAVVFDELDGDAAAAANTAGPVDVDVDGNAGVNVAAGHYNAQANVSTIAVATGGDGDGNDDDDTFEEDGALAKANTTSLQHLGETLYGPADSQGDNADTAGDTNTAAVGDVDGDGNIGVNVAAGAFNMQSNVMSLAVASDASLADASAGVVQNIAGNLAMVSDSINDATAGSISGAGNLSVNVAAGVGNMQHNSLTVAASGEFGGNGTGGDGGGGGF